MTQNPSKPRTFEDKTATRGQTPLFCGFVGPSSSGKTLSALRVAHGIQRVSGGDIYVIDTEAGRALHYADSAKFKFKFRHVPFSAPFSPLDYMAAIQHCRSKGAKTIVVDSMSHEHEGPGGVLEEHDAEMVRLAREWGVSTEKSNIPAWSEPKKKRRQLLNAILQMELNLLCCFRAKEKIKIVTGKKPVQLGWQPIAGEEYVYEMVIKFLLYPGSGGVPTWAPNEDGEKVMIKLPEQFRELFKDPRPLDEDSGQKLAEWAAGGSAPARAVDDKFIKDCDGWVAYWNKKGIDTGRVLAAINRATVEDIVRGDFARFNAFVEALKKKAATVGDLFPEASLSPPEDELEDKGDEPTEAEIAAAEAAKAGNGERAGKVA